jgi:hypothetical protein
MDRRTCLVPHRSARDISSCLNRRVLINVSPMTHSWCTSIAEVKSSRYILLGWTFPGGLSPQVSLVVCVGLSSVVRCRSLFSFFIFLFFSLHNYYFSMAYFVFFDWTFNKKNYLNYIYVIKYCHHKVQVKYFRTKMQRYQLYPRPR